MWCSRRCGLMLVEARWVGQGVADWGPVMRWHGVPALVDDADWTAGEQGGAALYVVWQCLERRASREVVGMGRLSVGVLEHVKQQGQRLCMPTHQGGRKQR